MTRIVERAVTGPQIHVFAIGVGEYDHLPGGEGPPAQETFGLRQLNSPPLSLTLFVDWVIERFNHPLAELATVDVLASPLTRFGPADVPPVDIEPARAENVVRAFDRWYSACDARSDNVAVFYFCGHGVERESQYGLLADFGANPNRLLANAIDLGVLYQAMTSCQAAENYFFVDSCRGIPFALTQVLSGNALVLTDTLLTRDNRTSAASILATSGGALAYAQKEKASSFTRALVTAFDGLGSRRQADQWVVTMDQLTRAITEQLTRPAMGIPAQTPEVRIRGTSPFHIVKDHPVVPVSVHCTPEAAIRAAKLGLTWLKSIEPPKLAARAIQHGWTFELPAECYVLQLAFPDGPFVGQSASLPVFPPSLTTHIEVTK
jgi:hypothetical protein